MKKILLPAFIIATLFANAQSNQVQNANNYLRSQEYDKAKPAADAAAENEATRGSAKLWSYRGQIYQKIYESKKETDNKLDDMAQEKAVESFVTCLKLDKDNIYKDDVKGLLVQSAAALFYKTNFYMDKKEYDKVLHCYDLLESALPYDFDQGLKRNNITKEKLLFSRFKTYEMAGNKDKTKECGDKLIEMKYKDPTIYYDMAKVNLIDRDTAKALTYIEKGKAMFDDNIDLINQEINVYLAQKKTDILKTKLQDAINVAPDNEVLHGVLANLYEKTNDHDNAEKEYLKALELKPDYDDANYNLGVIYFNTGNQWNEKLNALPLNETAKTKEYDAKAKEYFGKAVTYLEKAYEVSPNKATKQRLRQLHLKLGNTEKAEKYK